MGVVSEDGFWEFVDGDWTPTKKQAHLQSPPPKPLINSNPLQFANQQISYSGDEVKMNVSANEQYATLSSITTTQTHTQGIVNQFGNPFFQDYQSKLNFQSIEEPGADKLRQNLLHIHNKVQVKAQNNFQSGEQSYSAKQIIKKLLNEGEEVVGNQLLKIKEVKSCLPSHKLNSKSSDLPHSKHIGVRAIITNKRLILVDSTKDTISSLENLSNLRPEFLQRNKSGAYAVKHRIMHDFWVKSISHGEINGTEFHFSDFSESRQEMKRFHHPAAIICGIMSLITFILSFAGGNLGYIFPLFFVVLFISSVVIDYYISQTKYYTMMSPHGKKRELTIGYFDNIYNQNLILDITLEDAQNISDTTDWLRVLHNYID